MHYYITTGKRADESLIERSKILAHKWGLYYIPRNKQSVEALLETLKTTGIFIVERERIVYKGLDFNVFWHPSTAKIATGELGQLKNTSLIKALDLKGDDHVLDCTFGLGSDALRIAMAQGESGSVTGIESELPMVLLSTEGLVEIKKLNSLALEEAAKKIHIVLGSHFDFLKAQPDGSFDCAYFDPMFEKPKLEAHGINGFRHLAAHDELTEEVLLEALRVCRKRVVIKERMDSSLMALSILTEIIGEKNTKKVGYGIIKKDFIFKLRLLAL